MHIYFAALVITEDPKTHNSVYEEKVTFCVSAAGSDSLTYQWIKDGEAITDSSLPYCCGVNTHTLCISFFTPEHEGYYQCTVGCNDSCSVQSNTAQLIGIKSFGYNIHKYIL